VQRIEILNVPFDITTKKNAANTVFLRCRERGNGPLIVVTPNPVMVMNAQRNASLLSALRGAGLSLPDGVGIISAAKRMGTPLPERVTGIDTGYAVLERLAEVGGSVYLLGAKPGVAEKASELLTEKLPCLRIVGTHHGYFDKDDEIISEIRGKEPDLLVVCLGSPQQEIWVNENKKKLTGVGAVLCLGGALDVWSGNVRRAPKLFIKMRLEWLWRMLNEPRRLKELPKMVKFRLATRKSRQNR
jgi:N-acetylglucosaminyldiphosphoundecaprenol N-acetyl-beta-D-mannosaminyltransferase